MRSNALGEQIKLIIRHMPADEVTLGDIRDLIGEEGLLLLAAFLCLVFLVPVSIPGVSTVFGAAIVLIGVSRLFNRALWLPASFLKRRLPAPKLCAALSRSEVWVARLERISRPHRMNWVTGSRALDVIHDAALILAALLLMAPFGLIPFSNTLPALAVLFLAVGLMQRDGVAVLLGHVAILATIVYFSVLIAGGAVAFQGVLHYFRG